MAHYFKGRTHCKNGHPLVDGNLHKARWKRCAICAREWINRKNALIRSRQPPKTRATHCRYGHEYTEENTRWYRGRRNCRACHNQFTKFQAAQRRDQLREMAAAGEIPKDMAPPIRKGATHCKRGHLLPENRNKKGARACVVCAALHARWQYYKKRGNVEMAEKLKEAMKVA